MLSIFDFFPKWLVCDSEFISRNTTDRLWTFQINFAKGQTQKLCWLVIKHVCLMEMVKTNTLNMKST